MSNVSRVLSVAPIGFNGSIIEVESDIKNGLPSLQIVGLGNKAIDEARERVRSAIANSMLDFPAKKIVINLAPAELPKDGTHYDLPIALAILSSSGQIKAYELESSVFAGELALNGSIRPVKGIISIAETAKMNGIKTLFIPVKNVEQALLIGGIDIIGVSTLKELYLHLKNEKILSPIPPTVSSGAEHPIQKGPFLDDIQGQDQAKRAMVIAAAGRHNILLTGSPGAGKTMLANTLNSLLPALSNSEQVAVTKLYSLAGEATQGVVARRPFRSPHHTSSRIALIGGGSKPKPGEISLAHLGVLFLDEIPEYARSTLEALRQPLEDNTVSISRAEGHVDYPADFMLVATMNPCPCGYFGDESKECSCSSIQILGYQKRLSGPLLDRIDLVVPVGRIDTSSLLKNSMSQLSQHNAAQTAVKKAQDIQFSRYSSSSKYNSNQNSRDIKLTFNVSKDVQTLLNSAAEKLGISARSYFKIIKVARTIADLEDAKDITTKHIAEALQYRRSTP